MEFINCDELFSKKDRGILVSELIEELLSYRINETELVVRNILSHVCDEFLLALHDNEMHEFSDDVKQIRKKVFSAEDTDNG